MSFTTDVKDDLVAYKVKTKEEALAEVEGMLRYGSEISIMGGMKISFSATSMSILRRFISLLKKQYKFEYEILQRTVNRLDNHTIYTAEISNAKQIIMDFGLIMTKQASDYKEEMYPHFLRGAFLIRGTVNDPAANNSHLEISSSNDGEILTIQKMMNSFDLNARISKRKSTFISYIKSKQSIGDFLYLIGVSKKMEYYEDAIITKEIMASAKRSINLDVANQSKTNKANKEMMDVIRYLEENYPLGGLDPKLLMVMNVRKENPEASLSELLEIIHEEYDSSLTKSGLNHRFRKLKELAMGKEED